MSNNYSKSIPSSLKIKKPKHLTRSSSGIPGLILSPCSPAAPKTSTPTNFCNPSIVTKKKLFLEMMGYPKSKVNSISSPVLDIEAKTPTISLTDFMGNNKYSFLRKSGFIEIYEHCRKMKETKKLVENKKVLSGNNIKHIDQIREYAIRNPYSRKNTKLTPLFKSEKYGKRAKKDRIDRIQDIIEKCNTLALESKKKIEVVATDNKKVKKKTKKLSEAEKISIQTEMDRIRF